jgi:type II secretion system protein N
MRLVSIKKKWVGYVLYGILLTLALLIICFPSADMVSYLEASAARMEPPLHLEVERLRPSLRLGLRLHQLELALKDEPEKTLFQADDMFLRPGLWSLLKNSLKCHIDCDAYGGKIKGTIQFKERQTSSPFDTVAALREINMDQIPYLQELIGRTITGVLSGTVNYSGQYNLPLDGAGNADLTMSNGEVQLFAPIPFLDIEQLAFEKMALSLALKKRLLRLTQLNFEGDQLQGSLTGTIRLRDQLSKSRLDLRGKVSLSGDLTESLSEESPAVNLIRQRMTRGALSFAVYGTLEDPKIRFRQERKRS